MRSVERDLTAEMGSKGENGGQFGDIASTLGRLYPVKGVLNGYMICINSKVQGLKRKTTEKQRTIISSTDLQQRNGKHEQHGDVRKTSDDVLIFKVAVPHRGSVMFWRRFLCQ